jgi:regulator of replication initiation timing
MQSVKLAELLEKLANERAGMMCTIDTLIAGVEEVEETFAELVKVARDLEKENEQLRAQLAYRISQN